MKTRNAVVEGRFYPSTKNKIFEQIREIEKADRFPVEELSPIRIFGAIIPHAGHLYSGYQTIPFFQLIKKMGDYPDTIIIVHPNHSGQGSVRTIDDADWWTNSIGEVPLDREFAEALEIPFDRLTHAREHSAEVIIPFLQYYFPNHNFSIVPISMNDQSYESASIIAEQIREAVNVTSRKIMVIASCDFSHFLPPSEGKAKDQHVLDKILARDPAGVEKAVQHNQVTVCGYGPIMTLMEYAGAIQSDYKVRILARGHSGDVFPSREVVNYISMIMYQ